MRSTLFILTLLVLAELCFASASFADGCKSCRNGCCTIQLPVEATVVPPSIAQPPQMPPAAKSSQEIAKYSSGTIRGARRGIGRLLFHRRGSRR
jgi:hypothetical protein